MSTPDSHSLGRYWRKRISRTAIGAQIAPLVRFDPIRAPEDGYSVIIACMHRLAPMIGANLRTLARQAAPNCRRVILVIDAERNELPESFEANARADASPLEVECHFYTPRQRRIARRINWGWVYSWLGWSKGIAACRTRYAMLHDFDALLIEPGVLESRYDAIRRERCEYLGMSWYEGLGVTPGDRLARTFELMFDAAFVRESFRPIELFNRMGRLGDRRVEFDTFLYAQTRRGRSAIEAIDESRMVHPSQMICQFTDFTTGRRRVPADNNLVLIPYYEAIGGHDERMAGATRELTIANGSAPDGSVTLWGRRLDVTRISPEMHAWQRKQTLRLEEALHGAARKSVLDYLDALGRWAGGGSAS